MAIHRLSSWAVSATSSAASRMSPQDDRIESSRSIRESVARVVLVHRETRTYFHGRDEEAAELARRVQARTSRAVGIGLGKTSLLRAGSCRGCVARLLSVYVRVDYSRSRRRRRSRSSRRSSGQPQRRAIGRARDRNRGESLWESFTIADLLRDSSGRTLLRSSSSTSSRNLHAGAGRRRGPAQAKQFLADLADLVENRPRGTGSATRTGRGRGRRL